MRSMKKCPKCKAEIEENARFCLYCMTSFEEKQTIEVSREKNKRWPIIIAAVLVLALILTAIFFVPNNDSPKDTASTSTGNSTHSDSDISEPSSTPENSSTNTSSGKKPSTNSSNNSSNGSSKPGNSNPDDDKPDNDNSSSGSSSNTDTQPRYTYIEATIENAYPTGYSAMYAPENAIVITKVNYKEESGNYIIPDTIDGKKVAAIMPSAFSDSSISSSVKSVTLPSTVRTVWNDAFKHCYNLSDLYLKSAVIGIYENAFPSSIMRNGKLTIHCKRDCRNFNYYYYRNIADDYDAVYAEWNG